MTQPTDNSCHLSADHIAATPEREINHPLNPNSQVYLRSLGERLGMARAIVTLARVPPGRESFAYHAHKRDEEFIYVLSGRGMAKVGDRTFPIGPGDFLGFTAPSPGHHLSNPFDEDLVYLMGGERSGADIVEFAEAGKHMIFVGGEIHMVESSSMKPMSWSDWAKKK